MLFLVTSCRKCVSGGMTNMSGYHPYLAVVMFRPYRHSPPFGLGVGRGPLFGIGHTVSPWVILRNLHVCLSCWIAFVFSSCHCQLASALACMLTPWLGRVSLSLLVCKCLEWLLWFSLFAYMTKHKTTYDTALCSCMHMFFFRILSSESALVTSRCLSLEVLWFEFLWSFGGLFT